MHLVTYCESEEFGGAERIFQLLLAGLDPGIDVSVVAIDAAVAERLASVRPGTPVHLVAPAPTKRSVGAIAQRVRLMARLRPDIFQASLHTPWTCQAGLLAAMLVPGVRVVAVEQLPLASASPSQRLVKRVMSRRLDAHVAVGHRAARLVEAYVGLPAGSVQTIHNGVPDEPVRARGTARARPLIGSVGRLVPEKGFDLLVRAAAAIPEVDVAIIGEGRERRRLEALIEELGVADRVELRGAAADARMQLAEFDVFALPSRHEGFPLAILEAMMAALPVVASDVGSISESVVDGVTGSLVPADDLPALIAALQFLVEDEPVRARYAEAGRIRARELFTDRVMVSNYEALYERLAR